MFSPPPSRRGKSTTNNGVQSTSTSTSSRKNSNRDSSIGIEELDSELRNARESSIQSNATNRAVGGGRSTRIVDTTVRQPSYAYGAPPDPSTKRVRNSSGNGNTSVGSGRQEDGEEDQDEDGRGAMSPSLEPSETSSNRNNNSRQGPAPAAERYKALRESKALNPGGLNRGGAGGSGPVRRAGGTKASGNKASSSSTNGKRRVTQSTERDLDGSGQEEEESRSNEGGNQMHHAFLRGPTSPEKEGEMASSLLRGAQRPSNNNYMSPSIHSSDTSESRSYSREQQMVEEEARRNGNGGGSSSWSWKSPFGRSPKNGSGKSRSKDKDGNYLPSDQEDDGLDLELDPEDIGNTSKGSKSSRKGKTPKDPTFRPTATDQDSDSGDSEEGKKYNKITRKVSSSRTARGGRDDNDIWRDKRRKGKKGRKSGENGEEDDDEEEEEEDNRGREDDLTFGADDATPEASNQQEEQARPSRSRLSRKSSSSRTRNTLSNSSSTGWSLYHWIGLASIAVVAAAVLTNLFSEDPSTFSRNGGYIAPSIKPRTSEELVGRLSTLEKIVQGLSSSAADARSAGERADKANRDLGQRLTKLEKDSEEAARISKQLETRINESRSQSEMKVKEIERKAIGMVEEVGIIRKELKEAQTKADNLASLEKGASKNQGSADETLKINKKVDDLVKELMEANKQLKNLTQQAKRAQETADAAKEALEPLSRQLPDLMPVRVDKKSGQLKIDPVFWTELKRVFSQKDEVASLEKSMKKIAGSKEGGNDLPVRSMELDWSAFRQANEESLKSLFTEELNAGLENKLGSGALLSKASFLDLLHVEMENAKETLSTKFNENSEEFQTSILAKVRAQNDLYQKSGSWTPGGGNIAQKKGSTSTQSESSSSMEYQEALNDLSTLKTKSGDASLSIKTLIDSALEIYSSDRISKTDFALYTNGARVIPSMTSETYLMPRQGGILGSVLPEFLIGAPIKGRPAITALHHDNAPGMCWPFAGDNGMLTIRLARKVLPTDFSLEHISKEIAFGEANSAPKKIFVFGVVDSHDKESISKLKALKAKKLQQIEVPQMVDDEAIEVESEFEDEDMEDYVKKAVNPTPNMYLLTQFEYDINASRSIQTFPISSVARSLNLPTSFIKVHIASNHGNKAFTCLYRFRVHGVSAEED